ncbi:hypothetical protein BKA69DRAFT_1034626 [Paraphysoderma sedebokerense]|nr:hypothetical protein BKA69DRAFT_1034626 [Paraphysoderma sedebokerense]
MSKNTESFSPQTLSCLSLYHRNLSPIIAHLKSYNSSQATTLTLLSSIDSTNSQIRDIHACSKSSPSLKLASVDPASWIDGSDSVSSILITKLLRNREVIVQRMKSELRKMRNIIDSIQRVENDFTILWQARVIELQRKDTHTLEKPKKKKSKTKKKNATAESESESGLTKHFELMKLSDNSFEFDFDFEADSEEGNSENRNPTTSYSPLTSVSAQSSANQGSKNPTDFLTKCLLTAVHLLSLISSQVKQDFQTKWILLHSVIPHISPVEQSSGSILNEKEGISDWSIDKVKIQWSSNQFLNGVGVSRDLEEVLECWRHLIAV